MGLETVVLGKYQTGLKFRVVEKNKLQRVVDFLIYGVLNENIRTRGANGDNSHLTMSNDTVESFRGIHWGIRKGY